MKLLSGGLLCFGANSLGVVAHCSAFVQGVKLQLSLCPVVQSSSVFFCPGGAYSDPIILSRDARINIICPGCK